jgi:hypothetical protein
MSRAFPSQFVLLQRIYDAGSADYLNKQNTHSARADELTKQRTQKTDQGVFTSWESPQQLRECSQQHELADEYHRLFMVSIYYRQRATLRAYAHALLCSVRNGKKLFLTVLRMFQQLADLCSRSAVAFMRSNENAPPQFPGCSVLSLCHASNAPGVSRVAMTRQVCRIE